MRPLHVSAAGSLVLALVAAGCGSKGNGATGAGASGGGATSSPASGTTSSHASGAGTGGSATSSTAGSTGGAGAGTTASSTTGSGGSGTGGGGGFLAKFPDTTSTIGVLVDQLPSGMTPAQNTFVATHFVGSQKLTLDISGPLRAINPGFLVLHYHLSIWQSAPGTDFILDGMTWGNDFPTVDMHESWFWHNQSNMRIASVNDGKVLMNLLDPGFAAYWESSLEQQVAAGQYDGIFFDSAAPSLLQGEVGAQDARLAGTGARDSPITEWGGKTYIQGWEQWIKPLSDALAAKGIPLIPNTGPFVTTWDDTDYSLTPGIFSEGYADPGFAESDWKASTNELLSLAAKDKIMILQNYLSVPDDVATRLYYFANYLLVRGAHTYLDYFAAGGPLEWYPEWGVDLGAPKITGATVDDLLQGGVYRRDFAKGAALVNPSASPVTVQLGATMQQVTPSGGGAIDASGSTPGSLSMSPVTSVTVPAAGAVVVLF